jgi:hypothetical protein
MSAKHALLIILAAAGLGLIGLACNHVPLPEVGTPLDQADCTMRIAENTVGAVATATAVITTSIGWPVDMNDDQYVLINGEPMTPTGAAGQYAVTVPLADTYTITVGEPTRGVQDTSAAAPPDFAVTAPPEGTTASLTGFTVTWSNPDPALEATITLSQTLFGEERRLVVGPEADDGSRSFGILDLADFRQGAGLFITVTKIGRRAGIDGFDSGDVSIERSRTVTVAPGP